MKETELTNTQRAMRVSATNIIANAVLAVLKFLAGIFAGSAAMISDGVHTAADVFDTLIVIVGIKFADKKPDEGHQYGHDRMECIAALILSGILFVTGLSIGADGVRNIMSGLQEDLRVPGMAALIVAIISIAAKEGLYWYTRAGAKKVGSGALMATAWHNRTDALSSVGAFIGIIGARLGLPIMDPIASVAICVLVLKVAVDIFRNSTARLVDKSCDEKTVALIREIIGSEPGVIGIHELKTRMFGANFYAEAEIIVERDRTAGEIFALTDDVRRKMKEKIPQMKDCTISIRPDN
ncbi:MAG: cation diffusion facilitator family transporter [Eubacteriaceae bacterium]|nr:cation diffusion facilitator family transporter [Eubacteriaceae bacterium]